MLDFPTSPVFFNINIVGSLQGGFTRREIKMD